MGQFLARHRSRYSELDTSLDIDDTQVTNKGLRDPNARKAKSKRHKSKIYKDVGDGEDDEFDDEDPEHVIDAEETTGENDGNDTNDDDDDSPTIELLEGVACERNVPYLGARSGRKEKADIYYPAHCNFERDSLPGIIYIHGGGFNDGDKAQPREVRICQALVRECNLVCMSINYKLRRNKGQVTWPQYILDAKAAVRWMRKEGMRMGIKSDRIGVMGCSAGGNVALMLAVTGPDDKFDNVPGEPYQNIPSHISCAVSFYAPTELMSYHDMKCFGKSREEAPDLYNEASPCSYLKRTPPPSSTPATVTHQPPPILLVHGDADEVVPLSQSQVFYEKAVQSDMENMPMLVVVPGAKHSFDLHPPEQDLTNLVATFFKTHLFN